MRGPIFSTALILVAAALFGCRPSSAESNPRAASTLSVSPETAVATAPTAIAARPVRDGQRCGVCYAHNWQNGGRAGYGSDASLGQLERLGELGVDAVSLTPFGWMTDVHAVEVRSTEMRAAERMDRMRVEAERAHARGAEIMLKPHLWLRSGWRGELAPDPAAGGWDAWFDSYEAFLLRYAAFAQEIEAQWFCVGVELATATAADPERWRALIANVRAVYDGQLIYGANWDEAEQLTFWDALDAVGVQMFAPLAQTDHPDLTELRAGAAQWLARYEALAERFERPLILTEVGFINRAGGATEPWHWPERVTPHADPAGDRVQRDAYLAIIDTFGQSERVAAMYWWKVFTDPETDEEGPVGFSPLGKPAEEVLAAACR